MTPGIKPYSDYKPSGVEWLDDVPAHWEVRRGKTLFQPVDVRSQTGSEELLTVSSEQGIVPRKSANVTMFKAESYVGYKLCWPGDLVINSLWAWAYGLGVSQYHGIVSSAYGVYRLLSNLDNPQFVHWLVRSTSFQWELQVRSKGIWISRLQLTDEAFLGSPFPCPPLAEQAAIVRYLDHVDGRIGRCIDDKERLVGLLEEKRRAVVHRAVTRGLDPNVRLKPSGVEWLGDVPAHWEVRRLKSICRLAYGDSLSSESRMDGDIPVYGSNGRVGVHCLPNTDGKCLVIGRKGSFGKVHYCSNSVFAIDTTFFVDRQYTNANVRWLYYLLGWLQLDSVSKDSAVPGLNREDAYQRMGVYPPLTEQAAIVAHLDKATAAIDAAVACARRQVELLREYRARLIADVVTGKLDVREAAANLPDDITAAVDFDETDFSGAEA